MTPITVIFRTVNTIHCIHYAAKSRRGIAVVRLRQTGKSCFPKGLFHSGYAANFLCHNSKLLGGLWVLMSATNGVKYNIVIG